MQTYNARQIADFFLARSDAETGDLLSNLKLQKLCYYAAGVFSAVRNLDEPPLFEEPLHAWKHGPVVPDLYHAFKEHGGQSIPQNTNFDFSVIEEPDRTVLDDVYNFYGQYSAWKLREMTHEEAPWIDAFEKANDQITRESLRAYFVNQVGEQYRASYRAAATQGYSLAHLATLAPSGPRYRAEHDATFIVTLVNNWPAIREENATLRARLKELEGALEPFAKAADTFDPPEGDDGETLRSGYGEIKELTFGDLRRARAAFKGEASHD